MRFRLHQEHHVPIHVGPTFKSMISAHGYNKASSIFEQGIRHAWSHSELGCEYFDKGQNPLTVDFKFRGSLDLMLVLGSSCSRQASHLGLQDVPRKSTSSKARVLPNLPSMLAPKLEIHRAVNSAVNF